MIDWIDLNNGLAENAYFIITIVSVAVLVTLTLVKFFRRTTSFSSEKLPSSRFAQVDSLSIHYFDEGKGFPILLLHGIGGSNYVWRFIIGALAKRYRVIAPDLIGFGKSSKPQNFDYTLESQTKVIGHFLTQLRINRYFVVGSSMGGVIALSLCKTFPAKVLKAALIGPAADPRVAPFNLSKMEKYSYLFTFAGRPFFMKNILKLIYSDPKKLITPESIFHYGSPYYNKDAILAFIKSINLLRDKRIPNTFKNVNQPLLILWGEKDKIIPRRSIDLLIRTLDLPPKVLLDPLSGHHNMEDNPKFTIKSLIAFFKKE